MSVVGTQFVDLHVTPNGDNALAYRLTVPAKWVYAREIGPVIDQLLVPRTVGLFTESPGDGAPSIAVTITRVPFEISLHSWVPLFLRESGFRTIFARYLPGLHAAGLHGAIYDATAVRTDVRGDGSPSEQLVRTTARVDGARIVSVNTFCDRDRWNDMEEVYRTAHMTFSLENGTGLSQLEPLKTIAVKSPSFSTECPLSWAGEAAAASWPNISSIDLRLTNARRTVLLGYLQLRAQMLSAVAPLPTAADLHHESLARLKKSFGIVPRSSLALTEDDDPLGSAVKGWLGGFSVEGESAGQQVCVRLGYVARQPLILHLVSVSPSVRADPLIALRTERAFDLSRATLRLAA